MTNRIALGVLILTQVGIPEVTNGENNQKRIIKF